MSNMNFNCDVCGREVFSCTFVNGMKFCAKCYQETFGETDKDRKIADLEAKLAESEKENKTLKDIRTLERVVPRNAQLNKLSNRDCYLKGFENAISETIRTFEETYGKEKCKLIEERDKYLMDIVKAGGYEYQIDQLKQQLAESEKERELDNSSILLSRLNTSSNSLSLEFMSASAFSLLRLIVTLAVAFCAATTS